MSVGGAGAPPPPTLANDEVSYFAKFGDSRRSHDCVGTPTKIVTLWRSMSCRARSGSQRYVITSFTWKVKQVIMTGMHPVTWKSGTIKMKHGGLALGASGPRRTDAAAARDEKAKIVCTTAPCVETAPLGKPV